MKNTLNRIFSVFKAEKTNILRNSKSLITFIVMPVVLLILVAIEKSESNYLILVFGAIMPPLIASAAVIGEDKEAGVLKSLCFSGMKWYEYMIGIALAIGMFALISVALMGMILEYSLGASMDVTVITCVLGTIVCSMMIGAIIGLLSKNQSSISAVAVPISLIMIFSSILGLNYEKAHVFSKYLFSQCLIDMIIRGEAVKTEIIIFICNILIAVAGFFLAYGKRRVKKRNVLH